MKKILIWDVFTVINTGGPSGYLYQINEYLKKRPTKLITFVSDLFREKYGDAEWPMYNYGMKDFNNAKLYQLFKIYKAFFRPFRVAEYLVPSELDIDQFDYVHIHMLQQVSQFRILFPNYRGKIILTTHCPSTWTDECLMAVASPKSTLRKVIDAIKPILRPLVLREEVSVYKQADYLMFPCKGAREPYEIEKKVKDVFKDSEKKFFYVPTSIEDYCPAVDCQKISEFGIPSNAFVIGYFGRHISVKGYDVLCHVGKELLDKYPNLYILCAGKGDIEPIRHDRWIELGFIKNVDDLLPQCDLYLLPNKNTFFDIITLQVLRSAVPIIMSDTGGNKYFENLPQEDTKGISIFSKDNIGAFVERTRQLIKLKETNNEMYKALRLANRNLYEKYFTMDKYINNYVNAINSLDE